MGRDGDFDQVDQVVDLGREFPGLVNNACSRAEPTRWYGANEVPFD